MWERRNKHTVVAEVDSKTFGNIMSLGSVNIGWNRCPVYEELNLMRCYKCLSFHHKANECKNPVACSNCGECHKYTDCTSVAVARINCINTNKKFKLNLDIEHNALDKKCPVFIRKVEILKNKIKYT